jgi:hypothetical protein
VSGVDDTSSIIRASEQCIRASKIQDPRSKLQAGAHYEDDSFIERTLRYRIATFSNNGFPDKARNHLFVYLGSHGHGVDETDHSSMCVGVEDTYFLLITPHHITHLNFLMDDCRRGRWCHGVRLLGRVACRDTRRKGV